MNIQLFILSFYMVNTEFWFKSSAMKGTCNVVSTIARFVPVGFPVVDHLYAAIIMFSISIVQVVHMVVVFYSYKPSAVFTATAPKWTPVLSLFASNIMLFPSVCVFFYGCYHAKTQYGPLLIFFAAVSACVQFTGVFILVTCDIAFPSFRRGFGAFWVTPNYVIFVFYIVLLVGLIEGTPSITNKNGKLTVEIVVAIMYFLKFIISAIAMPMVTFVENVCDGCVGVLGGVSCLIVAMSQYFGLATDKAMIITVLSFPGLVMVTVIIMKLRMRRIYLTSLRAHEEGNVEIMEKVPRIAIVATVCASFNLFPDDWSLFDWMLQRLPDSFDHFALYGKCLAVMPQEAERLESLVKDMHRLCKRNFVSCLVTAFFEMIYVQRGFPEVSIRANANCCKIVDEYLMVLHFFWTEVLLGRTERLVSLSQAVNEKYVRAQEFFENLGVVALNLDHYHRYRSISTVRFGYTGTKKCNIVSTILMKDSGEVFPCVDLDHLPKSLDSNDKLYAKSLTVEQIAADTKRKLTYTHHLILFLPFYFAFAIAVVVAGVVFGRSDEIYSAWLYMSSLINFTYPFAGSFLLHPVVPLLDLGIVNKSLIESTLNNQAFHGDMVSNPVGGISSLANMSLDFLSAMLARGNALQYSELKSDILDHRLQFYPFPNESDFSRLAMVHPYINIYALSYVGGADELHMQIYDSFQTNESQYLAFHHLQVIEIMRIFFQNFGTKADDVFQRVTADVAMKLEISCSVALLASFVVQMIALGYLVHVHQELYHLIFVLPKIAISQLIDKLGSRISARISSKETPDPDLKYNLTQLSYQEAPETYATTKKRVLCVIAACITVITIIRVLVVPVTYVSRNYVHKSLNNMKLCANELIMPYYYYIIGHDALEMLLLKTQGITPPDNYNQTLIYRIYNLTTYMYDTMSESLTDISLFPTYHDPSLFLEAPETCPENQSTLTCRSLTQSLLYMISTVFSYINVLQDDQPITEDVIETCVGSITNLISKHVPAVSRDLFRGVTETAEAYRINCLYVWCLFAVMSMIMYIINSRLLSPLLNDPDFAISFLSSIPASILANFSMYTSTIQTGEISDGTADIGPYLFDEYDAFQYLVENILLMDSDDNIVAATPPAQTKLQAQEMSNFAEFLNDLAGYHIDVTLPPTKTSVIHIDVSGPSYQPMFLKTTILPVKKFPFNGGVVAYACTMEDVAIREELIKQLNHEANRVRMLMTQLVPLSVGNQIMSGEDVMAQIYPKILCGSFMLTCQSGTFAPEDLQQIQEMLRSHLAQNAYLTYFGRNVQLFHVVSGIFNLQMAATEQGVGIVSFSLELIRSIKTYAAEIGRSIDVHCGIHACGPFCGDILQTLPPVYDLFGYSITMSEVVAARGYPNKVNITREVYELIFGQGFDITFENEIEGINGTVLLVHMVQANDI